MAARIRSIKSLPNSSEADLGNSQGKLSTAIMVINAGLLSGGAVLFEVGS